MNKKIKAIELASRVYQRKDIPKKVKYNAIEYKYSEEFCDYENQLGNYLFSIITLRAYWMNEEIEILEDEDGEEIDIDSIEEIPIDKDEFGYETVVIADLVMSQKINALVKAVKQLDKKNK